MSCLNPSWEGNWVMARHAGIRKGTFPCQGGKFHHALLSAAAAVACFPRPHADCQSPLPEVLLFDPFIPGMRFSPVMLTEPINLSALISTLLCSPGVGGFLQSCSGEGSAGDIAHTSARAPRLRWSTQAPSAPFYVPRCPGRARCRALGRSLGSRASSAWSLPMPLIYHC